jgi:hypothetical protein
VFVLNPNGVGVEFVRTFSNDDIHHRM